MRKLSGLLGAALIALGAAAPATASTLDLQNSTLGVAIGALPPITIPQSPAVISIAVSSGDGSFVLPSGIFASQVILPTQLFTGVTLISSLNVTAMNGTGSFTGAAGQGGGFGGTMPINGQSVVGVLKGLINLNIPLSVVGAGGQVKAGSLGLNVTVTGHLWTSGAAVVAGITSATTSGFKNTIMLSGYDNRTSGHGGVLQLVSPIRILTNAAGNLPGFGIATLEFAPEPGGLLLMGSAIAGLLVLGRARRRR